MLYKKCRICEEVKEIIEFHKKKDAPGGVKMLGTSKQSNTIEVLGYSALELKFHIEQQFTSGMTWNNYGD